MSARPPNETTDDDGNPISAGGIQRRGPSRPKRRVYDDPEVRELREHLRLHNGLSCLEIVEPHEIERATRLFFRDGFVVVRDVVDADRLRELQDASARILGDPGRRRL